MATALHTILAQYPPANPLEKPETWLLTGLVVAALLIGAGVISIADRWRRRQNREIDPTETLTSFRALYERGEISKAEYDRIRTKVATVAVVKMGIRKPTTPGAILAETAAAGEKPTEPPVEPTPPTAD